MRKIVAALAVSAAMMVPGTAWASSLPYVDDVNPYGSSKSILTVTACGGKTLKLKATSGGKSLKVKRHKRGVWTVVVKNGKTVKLSVREKGERWKSIGFKVY